MSDAALERSLIEDRISGGHLIGSLEHATTGAALYLTVNTK
jgi:hypothetical protein